MKTVSISIIILISAGIIAGTIIYLSKSNTQPNLQQVKNNENSSKLEKVQTENELTAQQKKEEQKKQIEATYRQKEIDQIDANIAQIDKSIKEYQAKINEWTNSYQEIANQMQQAADASAAEPYNPYLPGGESGAKFNALKSQADYMAQQIKILKTELDKLNNKRNQLIQQKLSL